MREALERCSAENMDSIRVNGRDNARTPMQWDESKTLVSTGQPWLVVNPNYQDQRSRSTSKSRFYFLYLSETGSNCKENSWADSS